MTDSIKKEIRRLRKLGLRNPPPSLAIAIFMLEFREIMNTVSKT